MKVVPGSTASETSDREPWRDLETALGRVVELAHAAGVEAEQEAVAHARDLEQLAALRRDLQTAHDDRVLAEEAVARAREERGRMQAEWSAAQDELTRSQAVSDALRAELLAAQEDLDRARAEALRVGDRSAEIRAELLEELTLVRAEAELECERARQPALELAEVRRALERSRDEQARVGREMAALLEQFFGDGKDVAGALVHARAEVERLRDALRRTAQVGAGGDEPAQVAAELAGLMQDRDEARRQAAELSAELASVEGEREVARRDNEALQQQLRDAWLELERRAAVPGPSNEEFEREMAAARELIAGLEAHCDRVEAKATESRREAAALKAANMELRAELAAVSRRIVGTARVRAT